MLNVQSIQNIIYIYIYCIQFMIHNQYGKHVFVFDIFHTPFNNIKTENA